MQRDSEAGPLQLDVADAVIVYRVGYAPDPFAWTPWQYAEAGRFTGRWDDPDGTFRTLYVGDRLLACLLEVLADFRPDLELLAELNQIEEDDDSATNYPTQPAGVLPRSWLKPRQAGTAQMTGEFVDVRDAQTIATLRARFGRLAHDLGLADVDAAAIKSSAPRTLTQTISRWLYATVRPPIDGVAFASRFGDELRLWAVYEQPGEDEAGSHALAHAAEIDLSPDTPELIEAMRIHNLGWSD